MQSNDGPPLPQHLVDPTPEIDTATTVINRVWEIPRPAEDAESPQVLQARAHINWSSQERENNATWNEDGHEFHLRHSTPVWYSYESSDFKMVDLAIVGTDQTEVQGAWERELADSDTKRQQFHELLQRDLLPPLVEIPRVVTILGRGSVFDSRRVLEHGADVDLILFLDVPFDSLEDIQEIVDAINTVQEQVPHITIGITPHASSSRRVDSSVSIRESTEMVAMLDLMSLPGPSGYINTLLRKPKLIRPYYIDCLQYGVVLMDKSNGEFEKAKSALLAAWEHEGGPKKRP